MNWVAFVILIIGAVVCGELTEITVKLSDIDLDLTLLSGHVQQLVEHQP